MGKRVIEKLLLGENFTFSVEDAFNECETSCIPIMYLEEFYCGEEIEVGDLKEEVNIILI